MSENDIPEMGQTNTPDASTPTNQAQPSKKRGRPKGSNYEQIKKAKFAHALRKTKSLEDAYLLTHKNATPESAAKNAHRMLTPEVVQMVKEQLAMDAMADVNKTNLVKLFWMVIGRWMTGREKTADFLRALENMKELVPEFVKRTGIDDMSKKTDEELSAEIKKLLGEGVIPPS
jgi:hypothetical protein